MAECGRRRRSRSSQLSPSTSERLPDLHRRESQLVDKLNNSANPFPSLPFFRSPLYLSASQPVPKPMHA